MGKTKRQKPSEVGNKVPLEEDIHDAKFVKPKNRNKIRTRKDEDEKFVEANLSRKILSTARNQQREFESGSNPSTHTGAKKKTTQLHNDDSSDSEVEQDTLEPDMYYENIQINEDDEKAIEMFMSDNPTPRRTLADMIMEKLTEKHTELDTHFSDAGTLQVQDLDPKVKALYEGVGEVLKRYRSGPLPKAFKFVPRLLNWEQILYITDPPSWSAAAVYQATRIFASNLKENMAQKFYNLVLLPRIRDDLAEYKRLNFHLYQALKKALFKPAGFLKGIVLPLLESGNCTLREAIIVGSIIARNSIPMLHSAAAILRITEMEYTGSSSIILRIFFDKKYALPYRVIDACVNHFVRFEWDKRQLPVLWHQSLLAFVQRYKADISTEQKDFLLDLLKVHNHHTVTDEIRRELENAKCRDFQDDACPPEMDLELDDD